MESANKQGVADSFPPSKKAASSWTAHLEADKEASMELDGDQGLIGGKDGGQPVLSKCHLVRSLKESESQRSFQTFIHHPVQRLHQVFFIT